MPRKPRGTYCKRGHEMTEPNTYMRTDGYEECRACSKTHKTSWRENNRQFNRRYQRDWQKKNPPLPEYANAKARQYRARKRSLEGEWPISELEVVQHLLVYQDFRCFYCRHSLWKEGRFIYDVEHMTPLARGGLHDWRNVVLSCGPCNRRKHTRTADEFVEEVCQLS